MVASDTDDVWRQVWSDEGDSVSTVSEEEPEVEAGDVDMDERVEMLRAPVLSICTALGGYEHVQQHGRTELVYRVGDDCLECLRDLRRLWRQDDTDASRAIARVFAELGTLHNDLIPILLHCAGGGDKADKIALACTDLITALTWPIDWDAELHDMTTRMEEDENEQVLAKLLELQSAQVQYKSSILRERAKEPRLGDRTVLSCVLRHVLAPSLKPRSERTERDVGVTSMCLHLFRNLLAIRDPPLQSFSTGNIANMSLQSVLVQQMDTFHILDALRMLASQADTKEFEMWTPIVAESVYHMVSGTPPAWLAGAIETSPLSASLSAEASERRSSRRHASARHSRFGTTIQFPAHDGSLRIARTPAALTERVDRLEQRVIDRTKRRVSRRRPAFDRGAPPTQVHWTPSAQRVLRTWADRFVLDGLFGVLVPAYLRDIHAERERVGGLEAARCKAIQLASFFLEYAMARRMPMAHVSLWLEPWAFRLVRARTAMALESRQWLEFTLSVRLWTTQLRLLEALSRSALDAEREAAESLQHTLYYDGEYLDTALHAMHAYSTQSFACLEAIIDFSYMMPRLLERHASTSTYMFVKTSKDERIFRFESFQRSMASTRLVHACTQYLARYRDSSCASTMLPRLAAVVHRIIVRASHVALFFSAKIRHVWDRVMADGAHMQRVHPQAARDLARLYHIIRKTFLRLSDASRQAYEVGRRPPKPTAELYVRSELSHSEQIGVAVGLLAEAHKLTSVSWVRTALERASMERMSHQPEANVPEAHMPLYPEHELPDGGPDAAHLAPLRLLCRLVELEEKAEGIWYVPPDCAPNTLARYGQIIDQYLTEPLVIEGQSLKDLVRAKRPRPPATDRPAQRPRIEDEVPSLSDAESSPPTSSSPQIAAPEPMEAKGVPDLFLLSDTEA